MRTNAFGQYTNNMAFPVMEFSRQGYKIRCQKVPKFEFGYVDF